METAAALPQSELSAGTENPRLAELFRKANERWWSMQIFLGQNAMTRLVAMEAVGTGVDIALMGAGLHDPLTREPVAASVDLAVLHKLSDAHETQVGHDSSKSSHFKKLGSTVVMLAAAIGAQKAGLAVAEHAGLAHEFNGGVQIGSKWSALLGVNGANALKQRFR